MHLSQKTRERIYFLLVICSMLTYCVFLSCYPTLETAYSSETDWLALDLDTIYGFRGGSIGVTVRSNVNDIQVMIFDPVGAKIVDQIWSKNSHHVLPIALDALHGVYEIIGLTVDHGVRTLFSVIDVTGLSLTTFPYIKTHNRFTYTFNSDWTVQINETTLDFSYLRNWVNSFNLDFTARHSDNLFTIRFTKEPEITIDLSFIFLHKGVKLLVNGTLDTARDFDFQFNTPVKMWLNRFQSGFIIFDYSDIKNEFTRTESGLVVHIPKTFSIDPYIFEAGYESGDFSEFDGTNISGATCEISATWARTGTYSQRFYDNDGTGRGYAYYNFISSYDLLYCRFFLYITQFPETDDLTYANVFAFSDGASYEQLLLRIMADSGGRDWRFRLNDGADDFYVGSGFNLDQQYEIECMIYIHNIDGYARLWIDNVLEIDTGTLDTDNGGEIDQLIIGATWSDDGTGANTREFYIDDVTVDGSRIGGAVFYPPTNDSLTITNMDDGQLNPSGGPYNFQAVATGLNYSIESISIAFTDGVTWSNFTWSMATGFTRDSGYAIAEINTTLSNNVTVGEITTVNFRIIVKYGIDDSYNRALYMRSIDDNSESTGWETMQVDYVDLIKTYGGAVSTFIPENALLVINLLIISMGLIALFKPIIGLLGIGIGAFNTISIIGTIELHDIMFRFSIISLFIVIVLTMIGIGRRMSDDV